MPFRSHGRPEGRLRITPRTVRWVGAVLMVLAASAIVAGCGMSSADTGTQVFKTPSILDTHGPIAAKEAGLFWLILGIATAVFLLVTGFLLYSIIRFRARPDSPAPRQVGGNTALEITWTIVPSVILFIVLFATISTMLGLAQPQNQPTITVNAIGHQWWWEFQYPAQPGISKAFTTADEMHMPVGTVVHINLISNNVIHSFWVPQLGGKTDVIPGHDNSLWLKSNTAGGPYRGECAEFCGTQHAHMDFAVFVDSASTFQAWTAGQQQNAQPQLAGLSAAQVQLVKQGEQYFAASACLSCHQINGVTPINPNLIGPNLTHFGSRLLIAGGVLDNTQQNVAHWIGYAQDVKNGADMPSFHGQISDSNISALAAYLESLK